MTVQELQNHITDLINTGHGNDEVCIKVRYGVTTFGATPAAGIKSIFPGFDWDHGRVILTPDRPLNTNHKDRE